MNSLQNSIALQCLTGPEAGKTFSVNKPCIAIGREPRTNDIITQDPTVSRNHAQIVREQNSWVIKNISSNDNILFVNQSKVPSQQQLPIHHSDTIKLGRDTSFIFLTGPTSVLPATPVNMPVLKTERAGTMMANLPTLTITTNTTQHKQTHQLTKAEISIGRDPGNDIVIDEPIISSLHCQIVRDNGKFVLIHPHPKRPRTVNGLLYQGRHIRGDQAFRQALAPGDVFRIGNEYGTLVTLSYSDGTETRETVPTLPPITLGAQEITFGRLSDNMVVLNHPQVSAHHARLVAEKGSYRIIDLNSTNHVYVNGKQATSQLLKINDDIRIGPYKFTYRGNLLTQQDESQSIRIDAFHLKKTGNKNSILLNDISLSIPPRSFVALVGGSGAGKSTLLDALNGLRPAQEGQVLYNGQNYYQNLAAFSTQLGYVPQDDIVHRDLTVEKALYYAAKLRLPADFTDQQIQARIDEVVEDVEIKHRRKLLISKLSGGQRKRVSIALELLARPSVFFLDEPTSGLDPGLDRKMMLLLRRLADRGHTIILVTHATNNISVCDYVCFLCQGGRLAYFGPPDEARAYFGQADFADIYSALEPTDDNPHVPQEAEARFRNSDEYKKYVLALLNQAPAAPTAHIPVISHYPTQALSQITQPKRGNPWRQFVLLSLRYIELLKNDVGNLLLLLLQAPVIGLILYLLIRFLLGTDTFSTSQISQSGINAEKTLFIMAFAAVMFGCINAAREIVKEAAIYRRERTVNLGIVPYMFSKFIVLGTLCLLQSAVLVLMVNLASPFHQGIFLPVLLEIYISMALTSLSGLMLGLAVSALAPNNDRAMSFIPIILIPQVIFSGIMFKLDGLASGLSDLFSARWAMVAMGSSIGLHSRLVGADDFAFHGTLDGAFSKAEASRHLLLAWGMLVLMIIVLGVATGYFLKRKDVRTK